MFMESVMFYFICYAAVLLQYSKSAWSKVGTITFYMFTSCILMPQNGIRGGNICKMDAIFTMFSGSELSFQQFQIK